MEESTKGLELQEEINKIVSEYRLSFDCPHCHKEINETHFSEKEKTFQLINEKVRKIAEVEVNSRKFLYEQQWLKQIKENKTYEKFQEVIEKTITIERLKNTIETLNSNIAKLKSSEEVEKLERVKELKEKVDKYQRENEELKIGNQPEIQTLKKNIKKLEEEKAELKLKSEKDLAKATSSDTINELKIVKELKEERDKYQKENEDTKQQLSELKSSEYIEKLERVRKLVEENNELRNQNQSLRDQGRMSKKKGEDFEQYVFEELNRVFDNKDKISKVTHLGGKADFLQEVLTENSEQVAGRIIYEVKNEKK